MSKRCIILNPRAGRGLAEQHRPALEHALHRAGLSFDLVTTHTDRGATTLASQAIEQGYRQIIAVGGDGTFHEVINGIFSSRGPRGGEREGVALGLVAMGTGNDFIKSLDGMKPGDISGTVRRLAEGRTRMIDVGRLTITTARGTSTRYLLNDLGIGIHALVAQEVLKLTRLRGAMVYAVAVLRALAVYRPRRMTVACEGHEISRKFFLVSAGNGRCQGAGFRLTPDALLDDGLLDLCLVGAVRLDEMIRYFPRVLKGTHTRLSPVRMLRTRRAVVESDTPMLVSSDGEVVATDAHRVEVEAIPQALELIV
ncbi:MAG: YegS/Rv2252/BmrU family lipid kinase [Chloroflexaceae bacterium]|nr:YegS/Rv2252/BmrU family lipid kinase [Chloroflexaceae bacterium]